MVVGILRRIAEMKERERIRQRNQQVADRVVYLRTYNNEEKPYCCDCSDYVDRGCECEDLNINQLEEY